MLKIIVGALLVAWVLLQWEPIGRRAARTVRELSAFSVVGQSLQDAASR